MLTVNLLMPEFDNIRIRYVSDAVARRLQPRVIMEPRISISVGGDFLSNLINGSRRSPQKCWRLIDADKHCIPVTHWLSETSRVRLVPVLMRDNVANCRMAVLGGIEKCEVSRQERVLVVSSQGQMLALFGYKKAALCWPYVADDQLYEQMSGYTYAYRDQGRDG